MPISLFSSSRLILTLDIEHSMSKHASIHYSYTCAKVRSRDKGVVHLVYAAALATNGGPLSQYRQS